MNFYESNEQHNQYLAFHYGDNPFGVSNYPAACAHYCLSLSTRRERALDLGCAVGRATLELATGFEEVIGIDLSERFIQTARHLCSMHQVDYFCRDEGDLGHRAQVDLSALGLQESAQRTHFIQGDACDLSLGDGRFDLVFAGNLIHRLPAPGQFLGTLHRRLHHGGYAVITSPYTLLEEFTPKDAWIGGYEIDGQPVRMLDGLQRCLSPHFEMAGEPFDMPFVIRETARKYQHSLAQVTTWRKK